MHELVRNSRDGEVHYMMFTCQDFGLTLGFTVQGRVRVSKVKASRVEVRRVCRIRVSNNNKVDNF